MLTSIRLQNLLDYNPQTGKFIWRKTHGRWNQIPIGTIAGWITNGRNVIGIDGKFYYASRLAFLWMIGRWPKHHVDHINGKMNDDRWINLREATVIQNLGNSRMQKNNSVGFKGVILDKRRGLYRAAIGIDNKTKFLGHFKTAEEAHAAYCKAAKMRFGDFAKFA